MNKEQTEACEKLFPSDDTWNEHPMENYWKREGFQAAQTPEMLMLNPFVEDLVNRLKISTMYLDEMGNWGDTVVGNKEALAPFGKSDD